MITTCLSYLLVNKNNFLSIIYSTLKALKTLSSEPNSMFALKC